MAVYEGARPRTIGFPRARRVAAGPVLDRRRVRVAVRAGRRTNRLGLILGAIVVAFMLAFFSLAQQVRVSATGLDIGRLELENASASTTSPPRSAPTSTGSAASRPSASKPSTPVSGSCPSRSSCRRARRSRDRCWDVPIRAAGSSFLLAVFAFGSVALVARLAYWQVVDRDRLAAEALAQTTVTLETPSKRGDIYDRTGTVVLATTVQRERLVAAPANLTPDQRRTTVAALAGILGLDDAATIALRDKLTGSRQVRDPAPRARPRHGRPDPSRDRRAGGLHPLARTGTGARLSAGRRRAGLEPRGASPGLRQSRGRRPVRHRAGLPGDPGRRAADRHRRPGRERASRSSTTRRSPRTARPGPI